MKTRIILIPILTLLLFAISCEKIEPEVRRIAIEGGKPYQFGNFDNNASKYNYIWDFGDGSESKEVEPQHTYYYPGKYMVNVSKYKKNGRFISKNVFYIVEVEQLYRPHVHSVHISSGYYDHLYKNKNVNLRFSLTEKQEKEEYTFLVELENGVKYHKDWNIHVFTDTGNYKVTFTLTDKNGVSGVLDTVLTIGGPTSKLFLKIPDAKLSSLGTISERYIIVYKYSSDYQYIGDLQDIKDYPNNSTPLIKNGDILHNYGGSIGFSYWSISGTIGFVSFPAINNGDDINISFPSTGGNFDHDDLFVIVVQIGSNGKALGYGQIKMIPGLVAHRQMNLTYYNY